MLKVSRCGGELTNGKCMMMQGELPSAGCQVGIVQPHQGTICCQLVFGADTYMQYIHIDMGVCILCTCTYAAYTCRDMIAAALMDRQQLFQHDSSPPEYQRPSWDLPLPDHGCPGIPPPQPSQKPASNAQTASSICRGLNLYELSEGSVGNGRPTKCFCMPS